MFEKPLPPEILERMKTIGVAYRDAKSRKDHVSAENALLAGWQLIPEPKESCDLTASVMEEIVEFYRDTGQHKKSLEFLQSYEKMDLGRVQVDMDVLAGTVFYEAGNLEEAFRRLNAAYTQFKARPFQGLDPKYLKLVKERLKAKK